MTLSKRLFAAIAAAALLCAYAPVRANDITQMDLPPAQAAALHFQAFDPQHVLVDENTLLAQITRAGQAATRLRAHDRRNDTIVITTGCKVSLNVATRAINIEYFALEKGSSGLIRSTDLLIPVTYEVERGADQVTVHLNFPQQGRVDTKAMFLFGALKLPPTADLTDDYLTIASAMSTAAASLSTQVRGEIESKYKPEAVIGNFERLWGRPSTEAMRQPNSVGREGTFVYTAGGARTQVRVSAFPYHDGTKVQYEASLPYELKPDGTSSGGASLAALEQAVREIAND